MDPEKYIENQVGWLEKKFNGEMEAMRRAVDKVETTNKDAVDKVEATAQNYRESQNEWRSQLKDQSASFVTRRELAGAIAAIITIMIGIVAILVSYLTKK